MVSLDKIKLPYVGSLVFENSWTKYETKRPKNLTMLCTIHILRGNKVITVLLVKLFTCQITSNHPVNKVLYIYIYLYLYIGWMNIGFIFKLKGLMWSYEDVNSPSSSLVSYSLASNSSTIKSTCTWCSNNISKEIISFIL